MADLRGGGRYGSHAVSDGALNRSRARRTASDTAAVADTDAPRALPVLRWRRDSSYATFDLSSIRNFTISSQSRFHCARV